MNIKTKRSLVLGTGAASVIAALSAIAVGMTTGAAGWFFSGMPLSALASMLLGWGATMDAPEPKSESKPPEETEQ